MFVFVFVFTTPFRRCPAPPFFSHDSAKPIVDARWGAAAAPTSASRRRRPGCSSLGGRQDCTARSLRIRLAVRGLARSLLPQLGEATGTDTLCGDAGRRLTKNLAGRGGVDPSARRATRAAQEGETPGADDVVEALGRLVDHVPRPLQGGAPGGAGDLEKRLGGPERSPTACRHSVAPGARSRSQKRRGARADRDDRPRGTQCSAGRNRRACISGSTRAPTLPTPSAALRAEARASQCSTGAVPAVQR